MDEIKEAGDPTVALDSGTPGTDQYGRSLVLRPVLEASYRRLPPDQARLLRLLALAPGPDTGTDSGGRPDRPDTDTALSLWRTWPPRTSSHRSGLTRFGQRHAVAVA